MKIVTKYQANKIIEGLKSEQKPFKKMRFDLGKYKRNLAGEEFNLNESWRTICVWCEKRRDSWGDFWILNCITE
jgi:hypothetical protein